MLTFFAPLLLPLPDMLTAVQRADQGSSYTSTAVPNSPKKRDGVVTYDVEGEQSSGAT